MNRLNSEILDKKSEKFNADYRLNLPRCSKKRPIISEYEFEIFKIIFPKPSKFTENDNFIYLVIRRKKVFSTMLYPKIP